MPAGLRVLVLDGGGARGLFVLEVLRSIELVCGRPIRECFDLIVGTSIGAFLAAYLCTDTPLEDIERSFLPVIQTFEPARPSVRSIVSRVVSGHVLDATPVQALLTERLGTKRLSDLPESPRLLMVAGDATHTVPYPFLIRNRPLSEAAAARSPFATSSDMSLVDAIRGSTAAPTIYPTHVVNGIPLIDGAVFANNPIVFALAESGALGIPIETVVSIGTGSRPRVTTNAPRGLVGWSLSLLSHCTDSEIAEGLAVGLFSPSQYFRFDPTDAGHCNVWESNPETLQEWRLRVQGYIHDHRERLVTLVSRLFPPSQDNEDRPVSNGS